MDVMEPMKKREALVDAQIDAVRSGDLEEKIKTLMEIGVLTPDRKLAAKYKNWGNMPSRTPDEPGDEGSVE